VKGEKEQDKSAADDDGAHHHGAAHAGACRHKIETSKSLVPLVCATQNVDRSVVVNLPIHPVSVRGRS